MGTAAIEERDIFSDHSLGMMFTEDQNIVQAFAANRTTETFTHRIGTRSLEGRVKEFGVNPGYVVFKQGSSLSMGGLTVVFCADPKSSR